MMLLRFGFFWLIASKLISLLEKFISMCRFQSEFIYSRIIWAKPPKQMSEMNNEQIIPQ